MVQTLYGPDGMPHDFPDGMAEGDMAAAMAGEYPTPAGTSAPTASVAAPGAPVPATQMSGALRYPALIGQGLVKGAAQLLGLPGDAVQLGNHYIENPIRNALGVSTVPDASSVLPTSADVLGLTDRLGLTNRPSLMPQNFPEKLASGVAQGIGGAAPALALTGGAGAIPLLVSGAAGGAAGAATEQLNPDLPEWAKAGIAAGAGIAGGGAASGLSGMVRAAQAKTALEEAQKALPDLQSAVDLAARNKKAVARQNQDLLINTNAAADAHIQQTTADALASQAAAQQQAQEEVARVAAAHGGPLDYEGAGLAAQQDARRLLTSSDPDSLPSLRGQLTDQLDSVIPADHPTPIDNYQQRLADLRINAGPLQPEVDRLTSGLPRELDALNEQRNAAGVATEDLTGVPPAPPQWSDVQAARQAVGRIIGTPALNKTGMTPEELRGLYQGLSEDQRQAAASLQLPDGQTGADLLDGTNAQLGILHQFENGPLSKLVSAGTATEGDHLPGKAVRGLLADAKTDGTDLGMLRTFMPETTDRLLAAHLTQNPEEWNSLSASAKQHLVNDPAHGQALDDAFAASAQAQADTKAAQAAASDHADSLLAQAKAQKLADARAAEDAHTAAKDALTAHKSKIASLEAAATEPTPAQVSAVRLGQLVDSTRGAFGGALGGVAAHALGLGDLSSGPLLGAGLGLGLPVARAAAPFIKRNPLVPFVGAAGALQAPDVSVSPGPSGG